MRRAKSRLGGIGAPFRGLEGQELGFSDINEYSRWLNYPIEDNMYHQE